MKKLTFFKTALFATTSLIAFSGFASEAQAQTSRIYFAGYLGLTNPKDMEFTDSSVPASGDFQFNNGHAFSGALGIRLNRQFRLEAEYTYNKNDLSDVTISGLGTFDAGGEFKSHMLLTNLYYDFDVPWKIQPYLGGGLGYAWHSAEISSGPGVVGTTSEDDANLLWNLAGGIKYRPVEDLAFTAGYRYIDGLDLTFGSTEIDYGAHEFRLGIEWDLPVSAY